LNTNAGWYQLGPITGNNSLFITQTNPIGTLTLVTPVREAAISLLLASGNGNGPDHGGDSSTLAVNWSNGQTSTFPYTAYDWGKHIGTIGPNAGTAIGGLDRIDRSSGLLNDGGSTLSLYYYDIDLTADVNYQAGALIDSVSPMWPQNASFPSAALTLNVMGLSGATTVPEPSTLLLTAAAGVAAVFTRRRKSTPVR
jgi:hypothetical protein